MPLLTPDIEKKLYAETDARFWAQYGYKPGQKLNPHDPKDRAFVPAWTDIYKKVKAEWSAGKLVTTYDHPAVVGLITEAAHEFENAASSMGAALASENPTEKDAHATQAAASHAAANAATAKAATYQPPTADPKLAQQAASQIAAHLVATAPAGVSQAVANAVESAIQAPIAPAAPVTISPRESLDALAAAHAPQKAADTYTQTPAPDAPQPPQKPVGKTLAVIGGCFAAIMLAGVIGGSNQPQGYYRR